MAWPAGHRIHQPNSSPALSSAGRRPMAGKMKSIKTTPGIFSSRPGCFTIGLRSVESGLVNVVHVRAEQRWNLMNDGIRVFHSW